MTTEVLVFEASFQKIGHLTNMKSISTRNIIVPMDFVIVLLQYYGYNIDIVYCSGSVGYV